MSERIYYKKPYLQEIDAVVDSISEYKKNIWAVTLDKTIFYPEGGGQPGDRGTLGGTPVVDTIKEDGEILHLTDTLPDFGIGDVVSCVLDWEHRFDYMQQHTGQHILSGVLYRCLSIGTVSVHQGEEYVTIETDREQITDEEIAVLERESNAVIAANTAVSYDETSEEQIAQMDLRRAPKVSGKIRLVTIDQCDIIACGGIHLSSTGEALLIRCIGSEIVRSRVRLVFKIGRRAMDDYRMKDETVRTLAALYSVKPHEVEAAAQKRHQQLFDLQNAYAALERRYAASEAERALSSAVLSGGTSVCTIDLSDEAPGFLKSFMKALPEDRSYALCAVQQQAGGSLQWLIACSPDIAFPAQEIRGTLFPIIDAKGGGKPPVWQGMGKDSEPKEQFLGAFSEMMINKLG